MPDDRVNVREDIHTRLIEDLLGPVDEHEVLMERPSDRYLTGIIFPPAEAVSIEEDDTGDEATAGYAPDDSAVNRDVLISRSFRPSSFGLSFRVKGSEPELKVRVSGGMYHLKHVEEHQEDGPSESPELPSVWQRRPVSSQLALELSGSPTYLTRKPLDGIPGHFFTIRAISSGEDAWDVTLVVTNGASSAQGRHQSIWTEEQSLFQSHIEVVAGHGTALSARPARAVTIDEESESYALLYRDLQEYAVGHTCSATWTETAGHCGKIETAWLPSYDVPSISPYGAVQFKHLFDPDWQNDTGFNPLSAIWLGQSAREVIIFALREFSEAYRIWIDDEVQRYGQLEPVLQDLQKTTARRHLEVCGQTLDRIVSGIELLSQDSLAFKAFQLSNRVMVSQRGETDLNWRPFQLAFQLLNLRSLAEPDSSERAVMDLLWFPTGGGKTEAYLGLIAFLLMYRRLKADNPDDGAGVAAIMRYTLRLLTAQQFQRAAAVICACEQMRELHLELGHTPFSIGLWVGIGGTPNTESEARANPSRAKVLDHCPVCSTLLTNPSREDLSQRCRNEECFFHERSLPVYVIDEQIYGIRPSLVIGTVDKFAQITRNPGVRQLFSLDRRYSPPDLILQDELHLVSGPLGTVTSLYEIAVDAFCTWQGYGPKVIGSTATVRRSSEQVRALFNRDVWQFPPSGIDNVNSGFAVVDSEAPGRRYVGVTTAGRSPKFTLQAVAASLVQSPFGLAKRYPDKNIDPYWTMISYFNSLRELGGALVLMEDDVTRSIESISERRSEERRTIETPSEITSRVPSEEIVPLLGQLERSYPDCEIDTVLASNMISVGVDVPRLGLMVVNGQPKTTAEYIQATSRVGRGSTLGLVVVIFNAQRPRDRSRYESFSTWHRALYREVEATSVTPFASRARDRALHAPLVALLRFLYAAPGDSPVIQAGREKDIEASIQTIMDRVRSIDIMESSATEAQLRIRIDEWRNRTDLRDWWWSRWTRKPALLISAEDNAARNIFKIPAEAWSTLNSMREVEPSTLFRFAPALRERR